MTQITRMKNKALGMTDKPLEMRAKGFDTMPKGFGNRWWPSVHEEKSEFDRVAPQGDRTKPRPDSAEPHGVRLRVPRGKSQAVDK